MFKASFCFILLIFIGCASTDMTTVRDPDYLNNIYSKFLVIVNDEDLGTVKYIEQLYISEFAKHEIMAKPGSSIIPPTREYAADEISNICEKNDIDAILTIGFRGAGSSSSYIKLKETPEKSTTHGKISELGNTLYYDATTTTEPAKQSGIVVTKSWAKFIVKLYDSKTGINAWMATSTAAGTYASDNSLIASQAKKTIENLIGDGVVLDPVRIRKDQEKMLEDRVSSFKIGSSNYIGLSSHRPDKIFDEKVTLGYYDLQSMVSFKGIIGIDQDPLGEYELAYIRDLAKGDKFYVKLNDKSVYQFDVMFLSDQQITLKYSKVE